MSNQCCEWTGSVNKNGYGIVGLNGKTVLVHRAVYEAIYGSIESCVLHTCDNRKCFRLDHLYDGSNQQNIQDKVDRDRANKMRCPCCQGTGLILVKDKHK